MLSNHIAVIHPSSELYGADRILVEALKASEKSTKKTVYLRQEGPLVKYIQKNVDNVEVKIISFLPIIAKNEFGVKGVLKFIRNMFKFQRFIKKEQKKNKFNSYYLNTFATAFMLFNIRRFRVKKVIHVHEIIESPAVMNKLLSRISNKYADLVICVSKAVKDNITKNLKSESKIIVLHNGIPSLAIEKEASASDPLKFYLFGRIMPKKGQWLLIQALSKIPKEKLTNVKFNIVGGVLAGHEHQLEDLKSLISSNSLDSFVDILPFSNDITPLMEDASVCLVPSTMKDPFPTTVLEAMSAGRLVIASNGGGATEAIQHNKTGLLFSTSDADSLKNKIEQVLDDPSGAIEMGNSGLVRFQKLFTTEIFRKNWISAHQSFKTNLI